LQFEQLIENIPNVPGVYQMFDLDGNLLYVGKAKDLRKRLTQYTNIDRLPYNMKQMRRLVSNIEIIQTKTESEALILESDLIKNKKPRYNILLTDDKMYPMLALTADEFPRLYKFRGRATQKKDVFGPYSSIYSLNDTIKLIQKVCKIRTCTNSYMNNRNRPCLLYQIGRCSAPCTVPNNDYKNSVALARRILSGDIATVTKELSLLMDAASEKLDFEGAAKIRDQIRALAETASRGKMTTASADYFAGDFTTVPVIAIAQMRAGQYISNQTIYPKQTDGMSPADIMEQTILWFYGNRESGIGNRIPIITNIETPLLKSNFESRISNFADDPEIQKLLNQISLNRKTFGGAKINWTESVGALEEWMGIKIDRADVFDNSHLFGTNPVGAMIVLNKDGFQKKEYRHYKLKDSAVAGNDIGMMTEFISRRYKNADDNNQLLIVDGGRAQWNAAKKVLKKLNLDIPVLGITKGEVRDGDEHFIKPDGSTDTSLSKDSPLFLMLRAVRDEAHRFAITHHRAVRAKTNVASTLDDIPGIGAARRRALLRHFGSVARIADASIDAIAKVPGMSKLMAEKTYGHFHPESA